MDRRGFLARLTAAAAGMAAAAQSGGIAFASDTAKRQKAGEWIRDNIIKPHRRLCEAQQQVIDVLRDCRVIGVGRTERPYGGPTQYAITYRQKAANGLDDGDKPLPYCNLSHHQILDVGSPVSITVNYAAQNIDVSHLGSYQSLSVVDPILEVEVVWLLP
jgi:hypothetical protein